MAVHFAKGIAYELHVSNPLASSKTSKNLESALICYVHGNGLCRSVFRRTIEEVFRLNKERKLYALSLDLAGHGDSTQDTWKARTKVSDFAQDVEVCLDDFFKTNSVDRTLVVGHSIGSAIAMFTQL